MGEVMESAITVKGQGTIPKAVRERLGLKPGDRVKFFLRQNRQAWVIDTLLVRIEGNVLHNTTQIASNTAAIASNTAAIARNTEAISKLTATVQALAGTVERYITAQGNGRN